MAQIEIVDLAIEYKKPKSDETFVALRGVDLAIEQRLLCHRGRIKRMFRMRKKAVMPQRIRPSICWIASQKRFQYAFRTSLLNRQKARRRQSR